MTDLARDVVAIAPSQPEDAGGLPLSPACRRRRSLTSGVLVLCSYLALGALPFMDAWTHWSSQMNGCNCWDQLQQEWFVQWIPSAIGRGLPVLVTHYLDAPGGISLPWNASVPLLGALGAPLTESLGVVHAFTILLTVGFALSASTMFVLLRRWVRWWPAAWFGGVIYGFCTLATTEAAQGRINLSFLALFPLLVLALANLIDAESGSRWRWGIVVGLLFALQLYVSEEMLLVFAVMVVVAIAVILVVSPSRARRRLTSLGVGGAAAALAFAVLTGYPLAVQLFGPDRLTGPPQSHAQMALFSNDLVAPVVPGVGQWLNTAWADRVSSAFTAGLSAEITTYVGLPLLLFAMAVVILLRRQRVVQLAAVIALVAFALSLGPRVIVANHVTPIRGPDDILFHLPVLGSIIPSRFSLGLWLALAVLLGIGLDRLHSALSGQGWSWRRRILSEGGPAALAVCCLLPLVPHVPFREVPAQVPVFFTSKQVTTIPEGSLVLAYPYPLTTRATAMLWQASSGMRFRLLGGYVIAPDAQGTGTYFADSNDLEGCLLTVEKNGLLTVQNNDDRSCSPALRATLRKLGVRSVVVDRGAPNAVAAVKVIDSLLGASPRSVGGIDVWSCAGRPSDCRWR